MASWLLSLVVIGGRKYPDGAARESYVHVDGWMDAQLGF
jgi:hypothetical protein